MRPVWTHVLVCEGCGFRVISEGGFHYNGVSGWAWEEICQLCPGLWLPSLGRGGACWPRSAWGHDAVHCGASGLPSFSGNLPTDLLLAASALFISGSHGAWEVQQNSLASLYTHWTTIFLCFSFDSESLHLFRAVLCSQSGH